MLGLSSVYGMMSGLTMAADLPGTETTAASPRARISAVELCETFAPTICRFAAMAAGSELEADDLAQDGVGQDSLPRGLIGQRNQSAIVGPTTVTGFAIRNLRPTPIQPGLHNADLGILLATVANDEQNSSQSQFFPAARRSSPL
jgi:hypothetical protein